MIGFTDNPETVLVRYTYRCDECGKENKVAVNLGVVNSYGGVSKYLEMLEPDERALLSRQGCPHAAPESGGTKS